MPEDETKPREDNWLVPVASEGDEACLDAYVVAVTGDSRLELERLLKLMIAGHKPV